MTTMAAVRVSAPEDTSDLSTFARRVRWARQRRHIRQADLAQMIERSRQSVNSYESKDPNVAVIPDQDVIDRLADTLGVSPAFLAYGSDAAETVKPVEVVKPTLVSETIPVEEIQSQNSIDHVTATYPINSRLLFDLIGGHVAKSLAMYVLTHDAAPFNLRKGDRVLVDADITTINSDFTYWLVASSEGYEIIRREAAILAKSGEIALTTGSGSSFNAKPKDLDVIGPILTTMHTMVG